MVKQKGKFEFTLFSLGEVATIQSGHYDPKVEPLWSPSVGEESRRIIIGK